MENKDYLIKRRQERRILSFTILGNHCIFCGSTESLHFDHKNSKNKSFNISCMLAGNWKKLQNELKKCQLLCVNCHKEKSRKEAHYRQINTGRHGTMWMYYKHKCRCEICKKYKHELYLRYG